MKDADALPTSCYSERRRQGSSEGREEEVPFFTWEYRLGAVVDVELLIVHVFEIDVVHPSLTASATTTATTAISLV